MEVELTRDQQALVRQAIDAGRLHGPEEGAKEAFSLWESRERRRAEIPASGDIAEASLARGEGRVITEESMRRLAQDAGRRGRARLAAEQQQPRRWRICALRAPIQTLTIFGITSRQRAVAPTGQTVSSHPSPNGFICSEKPIYIYWRQARRFTTRLA